MAQAFYGSKISANISKTPEGFLVCSQVPVARSGTYLYSPSELHVDSSEPVLPVFRAPNEVFKNESLASYHGKPITFNHPPEFISSANVSAYQKGTILNPRKGNTYSDGDKIIADLLITDPNLISLIEGGLREVSAGYNFELFDETCGKPASECECAEEQRKLSQRNIIANHLAIVPSGRAGPNVAIRDELPKDLAGKNLVLEEANMSGNEAAKINSERTTSHMKTIPKNWVKHVFGLGLKSLAASDASPEEIAEAASAANEAEKKESKDTEPGSVETNEKYDAKALARTKERNESDDMKSKDAEAHVPGCKCQDCLDNKSMGSAKDIKAAVRDGMAEMMAELRAKKDGEKKDESKDKKAKDDMPEDEDMEGMDAWKKSMDAWKSSTDSALSYIKDGLEELLKGGGTAKGGKEIEEEENKPAMDKKKVKDAEESNVPPTEHETTPEKEEEENKAAEDDDVDIIPALPKEDRPENPIPGADAALAVLRSQAPFVQDASNFRTKKAQQQAIDAHNAAVRAIKGRGLHAVDGSGRQPSYGDLNQTKKPEGLQGHDNAPKTDAARGAEYEEMMKEHAKKFRAQFPSSSKVG